MKMRSRIIIMCALAVAGAWLLWPRGGTPVTSPKPVAQAVIPAVAVATNTITNHHQPAPEDSGTPSAASTNRLAFRLTNTTKTIGQLVSNHHAILLENALIETDVKMDLVIPKHLRATGDPGAFIVQARGAVNAAFRAALAGAGGQVVSYIPNNAYLVQLTSAGAAALTGNPLVQAVLPYEPYYKVQPSLLDAAVNQKPLPAGTYLTLGLYGGSAAATEAQIQNLGGTVVSRERSPFGSIVRVQPPADWLAVVQLPGVQIVEPARRRVAANDLARATVGISPTSISPPANDYLGLTGNNVIVEVNDTGIDGNHPDFSTARVFADSTNSLYDTDGHGTHVAGIIAGNGTKSTTVSLPYFAQGSTNPAVAFQFRGKAPLAKLFSVGGIDGGHDLLPDQNPPPDQYFQEAPALTNALISNNSWVNGGSSDYDLSAASFDAAVRDALARQTGPQPVLFVFAAGNDGGGNDDGGGGHSDTIASPGTAKNVITVGALEQLRNITNGYIDMNGDFVQPWLAGTDSGTEVASYSARGNVGVGIEGTYGRFKPDVVAPGSFVVSTRSADWAGVYDLTNTFTYIPPLPVWPHVDTNYYETFKLPVPRGTVGVTVTLRGDTFSPNPLPTLQMFFSATGYPDPATPSTYDFSAVNNSVSIPPSGPGNYLSTLLAGGYLYVAVADTTTNAVDFSLVETISTTNFAPYYIALSNLDYSLGPWYRYDTGTSMATPAVSGVLALMQDYFTNTLHLTPSPALLKAMLINGARPDGNYGYGVYGLMNLEGWGLVNLSNSIPAGVSPATGTTTPLFFADQSPTNILKTGDSQTYTITVPPASRGQLLRISLAWTDPPGNPVAALKLVNSLGLVVTNITPGQTPKIYYGNSFNNSSPPLSWAYYTNDAPVIDPVNNVQNIIIQTSSADSTYSVTVTGLGVNVNAVTTEQTNIVQDYALVIACDDNGPATGISVASPVAAAASVPAVTTIGGNIGMSEIYFNQVVGAGAPLLNTSNVVFSGGSGYATNAVDYLGQNNQWHFYVLTNATTYTNAAFVTFLPKTKAVPREGVLAGSTENPTLPEANLDMYVATESSLTNLDPTVINNCISRQNGDSANLARGGTKFVAFNNSAQGQVYYVGVKCEDQMAAQYAFLGVFSRLPFSTMDTNGNEYVNGIVLTNIPDGSNPLPGVGYALGLALWPIDARNVIVSNTFTSQNFGDLLGQLSHDNPDTDTNAEAILNNHNELAWLGGGVINNQNLVYDDSPDETNSLPSDGPGTLLNFAATQGAGVWILTEMDDAHTQDSSINQFNLMLQPHLLNSSNKLVRVTIPKGAWVYDYVIVPPGCTNLTIVATNLPPTSTPPIELAIQYNAKPTQNNNLKLVKLDQGTPPGNSISIASPRPGIYYIGLFNPDTVDHDVLVGAFLSFPASALTTVDYASEDTPLPLLDDAVTESSLAMTNYDRHNSTIYVPPGAGIIQDFNIGLRVDHPRISDLVFTLIDPKGNRYLLMENRGNTTTNGCGATMIISNTFAPVTSSGSWQANTNFIDINMTSGRFPITYNFYTIPDEMTVYYGTNIVSTNLIWDSGMVGNQTTPIIEWVNFPPAGVPANSTYLTIIMNQFGNPASTNGSGGDLWTYTAGGVFTNYEYLAFTEDTNLTTTPIKFAPTPFVPDTNGPLNNLYYRAEQSLAPLIGASADGAWQLEVLDNRAGATSPTPMLVSWQLEFQLAPAYVFAFVPNLGFSGNSGAGVTNTNGGNASVTSSGSQLSWSAAIGASYQVQWKDSLTAPWNTIINPKTTMVNGVSTFVDDGTQTTNIGPMRFYRLVQKP